MRAVSQAAALSLLGPFKSGHHILLDLARRRQPTGQARVRL